MSQAPKSNPGRRVSRQRLLNVIYFVDASKTRAITLSMERVYIIGGLLSAALLWSVVSVGVLWTHRSERFSLHQRLKTAMTAVFDYQTRYDQVYEQAYPDGSTAAKVASSTPERAPSDSKPTTAPKALTAKALVPPAKIAEVDKPAVAPKSAPAAVSTASTSAESDEADEADTESGDEKAAGSAKGGQLVVVESPKFEQHNGTLDVHFAIRNPDKASQAEGYVWGVARFDGVDGKATYLAAPQSVAVDAFGIAKSPRHAHVYSIRYFKAKSLSFVLPRSERGTFVEVKIYAMNQAGEQSSLTIPVNAKVTEGSIEGIKVRKSGKARAESTVRKSKVRL